MAVRGILTINAPDGAIIATITHDADIADEFLRNTLARVYRPDYPLTTMQMYLHLNEAYAQENGNYFRNMGTEWLGKPFYVAKDEGSHVARNYVRGLVEMGFDNARWTVSTETGRFSRLDGSARKAKRKAGCTCRRR